MEEVKPWRSNKAGLDLHKEANLALSKLRLILSQRINLNRLSKKKKKESIRTKAYLHYYSKLSSLYFFFFFFLTIAKFCSWWNHVYPFLCFDRDFLFIFSVKVQLWASNRMDRSIYSGWNKVFVDFYIC